MKFRLAAASRPAPNSSTASLPLVNASAQDSSPPPWKSQPSPRCPSLPRSSSSPATPSVTRSRISNKPSNAAAACLLHELSYDEAHALAASGAKVLHAKVLPLAAETEMVVWVRNTFNPQARGTRIGSPRVPEDPAPVLMEKSQHGGAA